LDRGVRDQSSTHIRILVTHIQAKRTQTVLYQSQGCKESSNRFYGCYFYCPKMYSYFKNM